jgi:methionyl-tRNA synthetase
MSKSYLVTTPIFYPNSQPHIGTAHNMILADFIKRLLIIKNHKVFLLTGTDEHGDKIFKSAQRENKDVMEFLNEKVKLFKELAEKLSISYDRFIRTTDEDHIERVHEVWNQLKEKNLIYKGKYSGFYSQTDETFFQQEELVNGKAPTGATVEFQEFDCYFLKSSLFLNDLLKFLNSDCCFPSNRKNELIGFVKNGLKDLCISRPNCSWGIQVPNSDQVIYVWFDALINYLFKWNEDEIVHLVGKDISIFHGVHWPVILKAMNNKYFNKLLVHNWWLMNENKMSKSFGNVVNPFELIEKYGCAPLRFYCIKNNLINSDGNFDEQEMIEEFNSFAVNKFSNLVYRIESLFSKNNISLNKTLNLKRNFEIDFLNINQYVNKILKWMDDLNTIIEEKQVWKNTQYLNEIYEEIKEVIYYTTPIFPELEEYWKKDSPYIIFHRIKK